FEDVSPSFGRWLNQQRLTVTENLRSPLDSVLLENIKQSGNSPEQIARMARRLVSFDPIHQGASRALMRALGQLGDTAQALREYERCREALMTTMHVEPSNETKRVYGELLARTRTKGRSSAVPRVEAQADVASVVSTRSRLRVGVLPFDAHESESARNLAFSLSHEVAAALARFRWFDVIAPAS